MVFQYQAQGLEHRDISSIVLCTYVSRHFLLLHELQLLARSGPLADTSSHYLYNQQSPTAEIQYSLIMYKRVNCGNSKCNTKVKLNLRYDDKLKLKHKPVLKQ